MTDLSWADAQKKNWRADAFRSMKQDSRKVSWRAFLGRSSTTWDSRSCGTRFETSRSFTDIDSRRNLLYFNIRLGTRPKFKSTLWTWISERPLIRSDYSLMGAAISLSLMNQWNSTDESVKFDWWISEFGW